MSDRPLRLALINDYALVVQGLARMLEPYSARIEIVELTAGAPRDQPIATGEPVDVALYDSFSQTGGGRGSFTQVLETTRARRVVVYSWNLQRRLVYEAIAQGASGYLAKSLGADNLVDALERASAGETVVSPEDSSAEPTDGDWPGREQRLTMRESEIIALITQGLSNQDIADRAFLSINSVKSYIRSSYRKMGVDSRSRAVLWGIEHGFRPDQFRIRPADHPDEP